MDENKCSRIVQLFKSIADPRQARGQRYRWEVLLTCLALGIASGECTIRGVAQWLHHRRKLLVKLLPLSRETVPSESTLRRAAWQVDIEALEQFVGRLVEATLPATPQATLTGLALDGKDVRGARAHGVPTMLVSLVTHGTGVVLAQTKVDAKHNEIVAAPLLLKGRDLTGHVITLDALLTQRELAQQILEQHGHYLMVVKANQPRLEEAIEVLFTQPPWLEQERAAEYWRYESHGKGHGRQETRVLEASTALNNYLLWWPGLRQVLRRSCKRVTVRTGEIEEEVTYAITSLLPTQASAEDLERFWRGHWTIENRVHYVRDVTFREDAGQIRRGSGPQALAALRNLIVALIRAKGWRYCSDAQRYYAASPIHALNLLLQATQMTLT